MKKSLITGISFLLLFPALAQQEDSAFIRRVAGEILANGRAYENLRTLTKQVGARLSGSPQMAKAEEWGLQAMKALAPDRAWLQECMVPHWVRGGKDAATAQYNAPGGKPMVRSLDVLALGNSIGTGPAGLIAPVVEVASFDDLETKKDSLRGKIVFYNYAFNPAYVATFEAYRDAVPYRGQGASRAAKYGALAVIVRSMSHSTDNHPHTGSLRYDSASPKVPALAIGLRDADWLSAALKKGKVGVSMKTSGHFLPDTIGHNVIAEMRGSQFPDEYITIGGHLDSWDVGEGAHDDGTGCVQTIEILRAFKALGYVPKRTIRFVLFANEENGLRGGNKYAEEATAKGERHIFALESDAGGFTPRGFGISAPDEQFKKISAWQRLLAPYGALEFTRGGGGADIGPLARAQRTVLAGLTPDSQRYFDLHHARNDVFEAVNKRELLLGAVNMAALVYLVDKYGL
ncbi:MAG TPA: M20/M25/M40 family metallo-hydrolase [Flavisolibacter sp.]|nr:M20/M25/M40 family metallo-hydrolase [Flavisolibacter sp.]